jgi:cytoskeleton protein RodZ
MTPKEDSNQIHKSSDDDGAGPVCGERLAQARRDHDITVREIAKELHLDEKTVRALEENCFEELGALVFVKGHMRKYAEFVGVPIDDVFADYYRLNPPDGVPPIIVGLPRKAPREISLRPWIIGIIILLLAGIAWWLFDLKSTTERVTVKPVILAPLASERRKEHTVDKDDSTPPLPFDDQAMLEIAEELLVPSVDPLLNLIGVEQITSDNNVPFSTNIELAIAFIGDCWTEINDATGRRLYFDLATAGETVMANGAEPLDVLLGKSSNANLQVNGFNYNIPDASRYGNMARLKIYGQ